MGRDLTLYPQNASKQDLKQYIEELEFQPCKHLWNWAEGTLNYSWFNCEDFKSIDGVSADIYPVSDKELLITGNKWALHVRNLYSASYYDVEMLNKVLRGAKKKFGGIIEGDYGKNRYATLWEDESIPISRGVSSIYHHVINQLESVKHALPEPSINNNSGKAPKNELYIEMVNSLDPSRVIYNGLVPFAVSMFEYFFSQLFQILIKYDEFTIEKKKNHKLNIDFSVLLEIGSGKKAIEEIISESERTIENDISSKYTFQNLKQLNKAFKDWLEIDIRKILCTKKEVRESVSYILEDRISDIIEYRHGVVHHFEIDTSLTREGYIEILDAIEMSIIEVINFIEHKYKIKIEKH